MSTCFNSPLKCWYKNSTPRSAGTLSISTPLTIIELFSSACLSYLYAIFSINNGSPVTST
ncbi:hypothetical protein FWK35_00022035 [Aphis craccivora]|uniref:Uncharacterized protein n=1 Tax=Aphis craccivora TaxID=307492 RepID=A0A6G0XYF9_APHCR|nr:hypothetical protein FWK35_00022035 [Aphis craccivora]